MAYVSAAAASITVGVAMLPDDAVDPGELFAAADADLYRAKRARRHV